MMCDISDICEVLVNGSINALDAYGNSSSLASLLLSYSSADMRINALQSLGYRRATVGGAEGNPLIR
jgi:hypothetical protein